MTARILILMTALAWTTDPASAVDNKEFRFQAALPGPFVEGTLYRIHLDERAINRCRGRCDNLRVLDSKGQEVPYVVVDHVIPGRPATRYSLKVTAYDSRGGKTSVVMELPEEFEAVQSLELATPDRDFRKEVRLYSSVNAKDWTQLTEDTIYDFSSQVSLRKTRIEFPKTGDRYFRLVLADGSEGERVEPSIHLTYDGLDFSATGSDRKPMRLSGFVAATEGEDGPPVEYDESVIENPEVTTDEEGNNVLFIDADLPFERMEFEISNPYFYREIDVYSGITGEGESYRFMTREPVYRFPFSGAESGRTEIRYASPGNSFYKIVVRNGNNPPLDIRSIRLRWIRKDLFFIPQAEAADYTVYFGASDLTPPRYDLARLVGREDWFSQPSTEVKLGPIREKPSRNTRGTLWGRVWVEKAVLFSVIFLVSGGLSYWLYALLRKAAGTRPPPGS